MTNIDVAALSKILDAGVPVVSNQVGHAHIKFRNIQIRPLLHSQPHLEAHLSGPNAHSYSTANRPTADRQSANRQPPPPHQVQFSLLDRRPLNGMVQFCGEKGIKLLVYGSVGGGLLSDKYVEEPKKGLFGGEKYR